LLQLFLQFCLLEELLRWSGVHRSPFHYSPLKWRTVECRAGGQIVVFEIVKVEANMSTSLPGSAIAIHGNQCHALLFNWPDLKISSGLQSSEKVQLTPFLNSLIGMNSSNQVA